MTSDKKQAQNSKEDSKNLYKDTIFLPKTSFPMRGGLPQLEPSLIEQWAKHDLDSEIKELDSKKNKTFTLHDGPPYANGHIHIGHALNKVTKDIINRAQRMNGAQVRYLPGWDCHGLPIEWKVEEENRKKGIQKDSIPVLQFRKQCRDYAAHWVSVQMSDFQRLGIQAEWANRYVTMDFGSEAIIAGEIGKFLLNGRLYKGLRPVLWSVVEQTALAEAEVEYKDVKSDAIFVSFPITKDPTDGKLAGANAVIWTTTPWTIPLNQALAFGPEIKYGVFEVKAVSEESSIATGQRFLLSESLAEKVLSKLGVTDWQQTGSLIGSELNGAEAKHPFSYISDCENYKNPRRFLSGDFVTEEAGTGLVHMAPAHGEDDFRLCKSNDIELRVEVNGAGLYAKHLDFVAGQHIFKAPELIMEKLVESLEASKKDNLAAGLISREKMSHSYPHSWRSGAPLIYRATSQWFISMDKDIDGKTLRSGAMDALKDVKFVPERSRRRLESMVEGRPDWCISRQRSWGVPLPLFTHVDTGEVLRDPDILNAVIEAFKTESADCWYKEDAKKRFLSASKQNLNPDDYEQAFDVVDVWFESGCTHRFVLGQEGLDFPADLYLEGSDQHRGWFQSSLLESVGTNGLAPYKSLLTQGFVLDGQGRKMSKSLGNVIAPSEVINQMGADLLRLWVAQSDSSDDLRVSKEILRQQSEAYRRIRNTLRWLLGGLDGFTDKEIVSYKDLPDLEKYMLHQLSLLWDKINGALESHDWNGVYTAVYNFCNQELSAFYFDIRKDTLYCDAPDSLERRGVRTVLSILFDTLTTWLAPVLVFTTEEAWQARYGNGDWIKSIHLESFVKPAPEWCNEEISKRYETLREIRKSVTRVLEEGRASGKFGSSLEASVCIPLTEEQKALMDEKGWELFALVSKVKFKDKEDLHTHVAKGVKCPRCWRVTEATSEDGLCSRCSSIIQE